MEFNSVLHYNSRKQEADARLASARQQENEAKQQYDLNPTSETRLDLIEAKTEREEARREYVEADRNFNRIFDLIARRVRIQERAIRMRNENPFR